MNYIKKILCNLGWFCKEGQTPSFGPIHPKYGPLKKYKCLGCGREWFTLML